MVRKIYKKKENIELNLIGWCDLDLGPFYTSRPIIERKSIGVGEQIKVRINMW